MRAIKDDSSEGKLQRKRVKLLEEVKIKKPTKVIVTFFDESDEEGDISVEEIPK